MNLSVALLAVTLIAPAAALAQEPAQTSPEERELRRRGARLDGDGAFAEARVIWQGLIDAAPDPAARAAAHRRMAMSFGFEGDCAGAVRYHQMVIDYWRTREAAEPQDAFYQQGEMANESARLCIDAGDLGKAEGMYRLGYELGNKEPEPRTHPRSLWEFRLAHALGRLAARRGDKTEAGRQVAAARRILDGDSVMAGPQERFYPYLAGYVALYTGEAAKAESTLAAALQIRGNQNDPFLHFLLGLSHEQQGHAERARELYADAYRRAEGGHNPPAAAVRREARKKLAAP